MADPINLDLGGGQFGPPDPNAHGAAQFAAALQAMADAQQKANEQQERATAAAAAQAERIKQLKELYGDLAPSIAKAKDRIKELYGALDDGTLVRHARDARALGAEYDQLQRKAQMVIRYGEQVGGMAARLGFTTAGIDRLGQMITSGSGNLIASGIGTARSFAAQGMSGTVEQARLDYSNQQLARQFAAVMAPLTASMVYASSQVERRMAMMSGSEQNSLMGTVVGGGIGLRYGGVPGALAGGALGATVLGGSGGTADGLTGMAGGAYLGFRTGGVYGAAAGAAAGYVSSRGDYGRMRGRGNGQTLSGLGATAAGVGDLSDYVMGYNPLTALPYWGARALGWKGSGDTLRGWMGVGDKPAGPAEPPRAVTPFSAAQLEAGGTAQQIQEAMIRATAGSGFEDKGAFGPIIDILTNIYDEIVAARGGTTPGSAAADRGGMPR